jgi:hypothetical protein
MSSKDATPYVIRRECIQHDNVFVAAIRPIVSPLGYRGFSVRANAPSWRGRRVARNRYRRPNSNSTKMTTTTKPSTPLGA